MLARPCGAKAEQVPVVLPVTGGGEHAEALRIEEHDHVVEVRVGRGDAHGNLSSPEQPWTHLQPVSRRDPFHLQASVIRCPGHCHGVGGVRKDDVGYGHRYMIGNWETILQGQPVGT